MGKQETLPRLSRIDFFRSREEDLACAIGRAIAAHSNEHSETRLTTGHLAVMTWSSVIIDVPNGGFTQFFYNRQGDHGIHELTSLLDSLALTDAAKMLREAAGIYQRYREKFMVANPWDELFGSIEEFEKLERLFMRKIGSCSRSMDLWIREHLNELVTDEVGSPIDPTFSGTVEVRFPNGQVKESMEVKKGKPHGVYREYFENGSVRDACYYKSGKISGDYWPDGQVQRKESKKGKARIIEWFYPSGALQKRYITDKSGYAIEPIQLFHENGTLAEELHTVGGKCTGPYLKFFDDGTPMLQAEHVSDEKLIVHNAWNEKREQVVIHGSGLYREDEKDIDTSHAVFHERYWLREMELRNGIPHGKVTTYSHGVLWSIATFVDGDAEGESTIYWDNGRVRSVTEFHKGKGGKTKEFPKFDRPIPAVVLSVKANLDLYTSWKHPRVDDFPSPLNLEEVQGLLKLPVFLQEVYARNLAGALRDRYEDWNTFDDGIAYFLTVGEKGDVTDVNANGSGVYSGGDWETYPPFLRQLRFTPGRVSGNAIPCRVLARVDHRFIEGYSQLV